MSIQRNQLEYEREEIVILALRRSLGNLDFAAKELGCTRGMLVDYMANHPAVREEKAALKEAMLDLAEQELTTRMLGSDPLLMFYLRTQGKERGYGTEAKGGGTTVNVNVNAATLIQAMRNGIEDAGQDDSEGDILELTADHPVRE